VHDPIDTFSQTLAKAAVLAHQCAQRTTNAYAKDWYMFEYANDSFRSVTSLSDARALWPPAVQVLRNLVAHSQYEDVRNAAKQSLDLATAAEAQSGVH
jgi:hypothetical protein